MTQPIIPSVLPPVIFDLDGTLIDSVADLADAMNAALSLEQLPTHPVSSYLTFVGDGVTQLVIRALPEEARGDEAFIAQVQGHMRKAYEACWLNKTVPYPGISELLTALSDRGQPIAILSNKPHPATMELVRVLLGDWTFTVVQGALPDVPLKPHPQAARTLAAQLGVPPEDCFYVGDTNTDMLTARAAGMKAIGVTWGFRSAEELKATGADFLADHPQEILSITGP
ncbi:MAG: phosphoglycolate phosphatase [Kiritimatiellia bacterium]|jgi:phosphoglycolate phosphatase